MTAAAPGSGPGPGARGAAAVPERVDPSRSACVLIGVHAYTHLERLDAVQHNLTRMTAVLTDPDIGRFTDQDRVVVVENPSTGRAVTKAIEKAGGLAEDTLVVYYAGHGLIGGANELFLTLPESEPGYEESWVAAQHVRKAIEQTQARRSVVILDCCYSGRYIERGAMGAGDVDSAVHTLIESARSYVLTSAPRDRVSHAPDPHTCTAFTGALVKVLAEGVRDGAPPTPAVPEMLTLDDIFRHVQKAMQDLPEAQRPQSHDDNNLGGLGLVRNAALGPAPDPGPPPRPPRRRWPAALLGAAAGAALAVGGPALWPYVHGTEAAGDCSASAALLGYSDALDKLPLSENHLSGLSGLAFPPDGDGHTVYAVSDNDAGLVFRIRIGSPGDPDPRIEESGARTLRDGDGHPLGLSWLDNEALVVEKGTGTVLVASENGPSIRRFRLDDARQEGPALPVPKELHVAPEGQASAGRSFESLAVSPDGTHLYAGLESPLAQDGDWHGRGLIRIQRYTGTPGGSYEPDKQYAFLSDEGLGLTELAAVDDSRLLALERQYSAGLGSAIRVRELDLSRGQDVSGTSNLFDEPTDLVAPSKLLFDLAECPTGRPGSVPSKEPQPNPLLGNVEGMALGPELTSGPYRGRRLLLMVTDDNDSVSQITRLYAMAVDVPTT